MFGRNLIFTDSQPLFGTLYNVKNSTLLNDQILQINIVDQKTQQMARQKSSSNVQCFEPTVAELVPLVQREKGFQKTADPAGLDQQKVFQQGPIGVDFTQRFRGTNLECVEIQRFPGPHFKDGFENWIRHLKISELFYLPR